MVWATFCSSGSVKSGCCVDAGGRGGTGDALDDRRLGDNNRRMLERDIPADDNAGADDRVGPVGFVDDLLEAVVRDDGQAVHGRNARPLAVGQTQAAADGLLDEGFRVGGAERDDGVEVRHVPSLLEHVDVDHDLDRVVRVFDGEEQLDVLVLLHPLLLGVDLDDLALVLAAEERGIFDDGLDGGGVGRVLGDDEHEGLHAADTVLAGVQFKLRLGLLMDVDAVLQLQPLQPLLGVVLRVEVLARGDGRLFHEAVLQGLGEGIAVDDVGKRLGLGALLDLGGGGQFQPEDRPEFVDRLHAGRRPVAVRLVHEEDQVVELRQVLEVALADVLGKPLDAGGLVAADLAVDLRDVEDVDVDGVVAEHRLLLAGADATAALVVVAGDDFRRVRGELGNALKDVFRSIRREVGEQLVVDREVGGQHEEVADSLGPGEVGDERAHEPGLADAGGQGKAERWEIAFKVGDGRKLRS